MRGYLSPKHLRLLGARLHIHWSVLVAVAFLVGGFILQPVHALLAIGAYFSVILLHEAGHALVARRLGYTPDDIYVTFIHGYCVFEHPDSLREHAVIAWGGVLAQLAVSVPLIIVGQLTVVGSISYFGVVIAILGHLNALLALVNLLPLQGLDGTVAWRLIPIFLRDLGARLAARKMAKALFRRLK